MKRFFIKSIACLALAIFLAGVLPNLNGYNVSNAFGTAVVDQKTLQAAIDKAPKYEKVYTPAEIASLKTQAESLRVQWQQDETNLTSAKNSLQALQNEGAPIDEIAAQNDRINTLASKAEQSHTNYLSTYKDYSTASKDIPDENGCAPTQLGCQFMAALKSTASNVFSGVAGWILKGLSYLLVLIVIPVMGVVLTIAGNFFDSMMYFSLHISEYTSQLGAIREVWAMFRDTINVLFIFLLLYIAIGTILQLSKIETKKMLVNIIISALFINFSLFITNIVIDTGNIFASSFYKAATTTNGQTVAMSVRIMNALNPQSMFDTKYDSSKVDNAGKSMPMAVGLDMLILAVLQIALVGVAIWALFTASMLFLIRTISFFFLMALSPIGFLGHLLPKLEKYSTDWWDTLTNQAIAAPIFLFFMVMLTKMIDFNLDKALMQSTKSATALSFSAYFNFFLIIGILVIAVKTTQKYSGELGKMATGWGASALGLAAGLATGGAAMALRGTVGRGMAALATNKGVLDNQKTQGIKGTMARLALRAGQSGEKMSFDARGSKVAGLLNKSTGVDLGKAGGKGGYKKGFDDEIRAKTDRAEYLGKTRSEDEIIAEREAKAEKEKHEVTLAQNREALATARKQLAEMPQDNAHAGDRAAFAAKIIGMESSVKGAEELFNTAKTKEENMRDAAKKRQADYADYLSRDRKSAFVFRRGDKKQSAADFEAEMKVRKMIKDKNKSKTEQALETIKEAMEKGEKKPEAEEKPKEEKPKEDGGDKDKK